MLLIALQTIVYSELKMMLRSEMQRSDTRILITGGAGFIGRHLCDALLHKGHTVICLDNLFTGSRETIDFLSRWSTFEFIEHDVCTPIDLQVDEIYNLACPASPIHYQMNPVQTTKTGVLGVLNMLELAQKNHAKIVQASTSEVYGDPLEHPQSESYWGNVNPIGPRSCYDEGKRCAETLLYDFRKQYNLDTKIVRIFNTYGPNMHPNDGRVVSNFIVQALHNRDITIYGSGHHTRSFCYVDDLVRGLIMTMATDSDFSGPVNLGNPNEITIHALAELVISIVGSRSRIVFLPLPQDDPQQRQPDISFARARLQWEPQVALQDGICRTVDYFRKQCGLDTILPVAENKADTHTNITEN